MTDELKDRAIDAHSEHGDAGILAWLHWWHWLILIGLLLFGLVYFPLWQFEQRWRQVQVGDSMDRVKILLGDSGEATYSVQASGPVGAYESFVYSRAWRTYELVISSTTHRVISKNISNTPTPQPSSVLPGLGGGAIPVKKKQ